MSDSNQAVIQRADFALADLTSGGGTLQPEQASTFMDMVQEQSSILSSVRTIQMARPSMRINRMGIGARIIRAASQLGGANDSGSNDRWLAAAQRFKPITQQIQMDTSEIIAECHLPYEVLEDNIEGPQFEDHLMRQIASQVSLDLEEFCLFADTGSSDAVMALQNGWLKRASAHIVDNVNSGANDNMFVNGMLAIPQKYLRALPQMRAYVSVANTIKMRNTRASRNTQLGDDALTGTGALYSQGLQIVPAPMLAADGTGKLGLLTVPSNLIFGIQRQITMETDKDIRAREYIIVITMRVATQVEDTDAMVKFVNI